MFNNFSSLRLVDWEVIAIYTCVNEKCIPDFSKEEFYVEEYAHI